MKENKMSFIKIRHFYSVTETVKKVETSHLLGKIFAKQMSDKRLVSKIYEEFLKFNNKKTTQFKNEKKILNL